MAPTGLSSPSKTDTTVNLAWESVEGATGYNVYNGGTKLTVTPVTTTTYMATGLTQNTAYTFTVKAVNAAGESAASSGLTVTTNIAIPAAPTGLTSTGKTDTTVSLSWNAVGGATGYNVYNGGTKLTSTPLTGTTYTVTGLTQNTAYTFTIKAVNTAGESAASSGLTVTTNMTIPAAPTGITLTGKTDTTVSLSWNAVGGASGYNVYNGGTKLTATPLTGTTYTATGLTQNTAYTFTVKAVNAAGESAASSGLTVTTNMTIPAAPTGLTSTGKTDTTVNLSWNAVGGATGYNVYRGTTKLTATPITTTTYTATGLTQNTAYTFTVKAVNAAGESAASSGLTVTTNMTIPAAPTGLISTGKTDTTVSLSWNVVGGASGYNVYSGGTKLTSTPLTGTTYTATGLTQNTAYTFTVKAVNAAGESAASSGLTVTTNMTIPAAPTGLTSTGKTDTTVSLSWNAVGGASGYNVYSGGTKLTATPLTGTTFTATGLTQNTAYTFTVKAVNAAGESAASSGLTVTTNMTIPAAPTGLTSTGKTDTTVSLSWNAVGGASGYNVYSGGIKLTSTPLTGTTYTATGLTQNTAYTFTIRAVNAAGESTASSGLTVTTVPHVAICIDNDILGERIEIKVKAFQYYKKVSLDLEFNAAINYADIRWTSDNEKVFINKYGHVTNTKSWSRASNIKIELLDSNGNVIATDTIRVIFYKWNWQLKKLRTQSVISDNYEQSNNKFRKEAAYGILRL